MASKVKYIEQYAIDAVLKLRKEKGLTQKELAEIMGVKLSFVSSVESRKNRAKYNLTHLERVSIYFRVSPQYFFPSDPIKTDMLID